MIDVLVALAQDEGDREAALGRVAFLVLSPGLRIRLALCPPWYVSPKSGNPYREKAVRGRGEKR